MLFSFGRAAAQRLASTSSRRVVVSRAAVRVACQRPSFVRHRTSLARTFATRVKPATTTKKPVAAKKPAAAKKPTVKVTTKKPIKKVEAKKVTKKPAAKPAKKVKKQPSPELVETRQRQALKKKALYDEPKGLPTTTWTVYIAEQLQNTKTGSPAGAAGRFKGLGEGFRSLSTAEKQRLQHVVDQNKLDNSAKHKGWVESHTPEQIVEANNARRMLKRAHNFPKVRRVSLIKDDRIPKLPASPWALYVKARWASGDVPRDGDGPVTAVLQKLSNDWKNLPGPEKQPYIDLSKANYNQYEKEVSSVLHRQVKH